jgi:hypothetical protein
MNCRLGIMGWAILVISFAIKQVSLHQILIDFFKKLKFDTIASKPTSSGFEVVMRHSFGSFIYFLMHVCWPA